VIYAGGCHCGAIGFEYRTELAPQAWSVRACRCAFCRAHGALSTSDPAGALTFRATDARRLERYRFGLRTTDFLLCAGCGVYIGAVLEAPEGRFGIINVNALRETVAVPAPLPVSYEAEDSSGRIGRRLSRWTPILGGI